MKNIELCLVKHYNQYIYVMNYNIFNYILDYIQLKDTVKFLLHSNKNIINTVDWDYLNSKFNYINTQQNIIFPYSEGFDKFFNNFKFDIKQISCGGRYSLILENDNTLWVLKIMITGD
jgi:hypothetical protein